MSCISEDGNIGAEVETAVLCCQAGRQTVLFLSLSLSPLSSPKQLPLSSSTRLKSLKREKEKTSNITNTITVTHLTSASGNDDKCCEWDDGEDEEDSVGVFVRLTTDAAATAR